MAVPSPLSYAAPSSIAPLAVATTLRALRDTRTGVAGSSVSWSPVVLPGGCGRLRLAKRRERRALIATRGVPTQTTRCVGGQGGQSASSPPTAIETESCFVHVGSPHTAPHVKTTLSCGRGLSGRYYGLGWISRPLPITRELVVTLGVVLWWMG